MSTKPKKGYSKTTKAKLIDYILKSGFDPNEQTLTALNKKELIKIYEDQITEDKATKPKKAKTKEP